MHMEPPGIALGASDVDLGSGLIVDLQDARARVVDVGVLVAVVVMVVPEDIPGASDVLDAPTVETGDIAALADDVRHLVRLQDSIMVEVMPDDKDQIVSAVRTIR